METATITQAASVITGANPADPQDTKVQAAPATTEAPAEPQVYFINTGGAPNGRPTIERWIKQGIAITYGPLPYRFRLTQLRKGDILLAYVNKTGLVAFGDVLDDETLTITVDERVGSTVSQNGEYHRQVRWTVLETPVSPRGLKGICGTCPLQTTQRVVKGKDAILDYLSR